MPNSMASQYVNSVIIQKIFNQSTNLQFEFTVCITRHSLSKEHVFNIFVLLHSFCLEDTQD